MPRLISRADLARLAGVSRPAITKACNGKLADACEGDRVDIDHASVKAYLAEHGADDGPTATTEKPKKRARKPLPDRPPKLDEAGYSDELGEFTLHEIVQKFGTIRSYKDVLEANEKRERALKNHLDNEQRRGQLIERELVRTHVVGLIDATNKQLLSDAAKTIAARVVALAKSGSSTEDAERVVREIIGTHLKPAKRRAVKTLREANKWTED